MLELSPDSPARKREPSIAVYPDRIVNWVPAFAGMTANSQVEEYAT